MRKLAVISILSFVIVVLIVTAAHATTGPPPIVSILSKDINKIKTAVKNDDRKAVNKYCWAMASHIDKISLKFDKPENLSKRDWSKFHVALGYIYGTARSCANGDVERSTIFISKASKKYDEILYIFN